MGSLPIHIFKNYLHSIILFIVLLLSSYSIFQRRKFPTFLLVVLLGLAISNNLLLGTQRYLLSVNIVLTYLGIISTVRPKMYVYILLGTLVGLVITIEPNQAVYAAPAVIMSFIYMHFLQWTQEERVRQLKGAAFSIIICFIITIAHLYSLYSSNQLNGYFGFYQNMAPMSISSAIVAPVWDWVTLPITINSQVLISLLVTLFLAFFLFEPKRKSINHHVQILILLSLVVTGSIVFFKMLIRPHMGSQVLIFGILGPTILLLMRLPSFKLRQIIAGSFLLGMGFALNFNIPTVESSIASQWEKFKNLPTYPIRALKEVADSKLQAASYFGRDRFVNWQEGALESVKYISSFGFSDWQSNLYVFGDQSNFYLALKQKPPRYLTFFDGSNVQAQEEVVNWIEFTKPKFVIFDEKFLVFDLVPNVVRVPLIFEYIIKNYHPSSKFGRYQILTRRTHEPFDWNFWSQCLTQRIDLGFIPARADLPSPANLCSDDSFKPSQCNDYVTVDAESVNDLNPLQLWVDIEGRRFEMAFAAKPSSNKYHINLSRLWFWQVARRLGFKPKIDYSDNRIQKLRYSAIQVSNKQRLY